MKLWKRNAVVAAIVLFVCVAVYLNWSYHKDGGSVDTGKTLGEATLVGGGTQADPLLGPKGGADTPTNASGGYFETARLNRQQARDNAMSILQDAAGSPEADQTMKDGMATSIQTMASLTVSEAQIENLVTAKGYADCVAFIGDKSVSVVVVAGEGGLQDADVAKISEIVTDETGFPAENIKIVPADQ
ncbi:MAG: SpoIIIAH-like family protein [Pseudoflavonifractor sp.]